MAMALLGKGRQRIGRRAQTSGEHRRPPYHPSWPALGSHFMTDVSEQVAGLIAEAERAADSRLQAAESDAQEIRRKAEARAQETLRDAQDERRRMLARANAATSEAAARGEELGEALAQLGASLQTNARRVLD